MTLKDSTIIYIYTNLVNITIKFHSQMDKFRTILSKSPLKGQNKKY
jgi:hypothetical protein